MRQCLDHNQMVRNFTMKQINHWHCKWSMGKHICDIQLWKKTHVVKFWPKYGINMNKFVPCPYLLNSSNCLFGSSVSNWPCNNVFILVVDCVIIWRERTLFNDSYKKWLTISFIWYFYNRHSHKTITTDIRKSKNITRLITTIIPKTL